MILAEKTRSLTLVVSKGQSRNPAKRALEQAIADAAGKIPEIDVLMVPHLYDLPKNGESVTRLREIQGDVILASWIFPRAAHWVLDRNGIGGRPGEVLLGNEPQDADQQDDQQSAEPTSDVAQGENGEPTQRMTDLYPRPDRQVFCIDLRTSESTSDFIGEVLRIIELQPDALDSQSLPTASRSLPVVGGQIESIEETTGRRWYPVIDYSRCTNCMECVDFCLFGVYGVDGAESILVEQPDNCRKGCPACSRVCPENAIIFPQHKAPAIAGADTEGDEGFKIDLSLLFGAPSGSDDPIATAARERDEHLLLAGRDTVGIDEQLKKRQATRDQQPKDELDRLVDSLDEMDL